jgi:hypothetical protein
MNAVFVGKIGKASGLAPKRDHPVDSRVALISLASCPHHVSRLVVAVVVDPVERNVAAFRSPSNIVNEGLE